MQIEYEGMQTEASFGLVALRKLSRDPRSRWAQVVGRVKGVGPMLQEGRCLRRVHAKAPRARPV